MFTINNYTDADKPLEWNVDYVIYQKEKGKEGTPHLQGYVELARISRISALKKIHPTAHWDRRKGTQDQAIAYCTKQDETYVEGPWSKGERCETNQGRRTDLDLACEVAKTDGIAAVAEEYPTAYAKYTKGLKEIANYHRDQRRAVERKRKYEDVSLRPWQQVLEKKLEKEADDRKIYWYWDPTGNTGKTFMAKYLEATKGATVLDCSKKVDLAYLLRGHEGAVVLFNIVRSMDEAYMGHVYGLAEAIKDDMVTSMKYEPVRVHLGPQHVVVFSNVEPDYTKWSEDRYQVTQIMPDSLDLNPLTEPPKKKPKPLPLTGPLPTEEEEENTQTAKCGKCADYAPCFCAQNAPNQLVKGCQS